MALVFFYGIPYNTLMQAAAPHKPSISVGDFEGPIEVLLRMIQERKLPINDISLAEVADEYIAYIQSHRRDDYSYITHFLYIASTLLLIKSRSLLPSLELSGEEEESIDDLQRRLRLYQLFSEKAELLKPLSSSPSMFTRPFRMRRITVFSPDAQSMTLPNLLEAVQGIEVTVEQKQTMPEARIRTASVHIQDLINSLTERVKEGMQKHSFKEFTKAPLSDATHREQKVYTIVGFLAMLEMVKNGLLSAAQEETFHDIMMSS
jgi:segregation and condensation protein A